MKKDNKGFSLVELIVVVLIMGILAVALTPQVIRWVDRSRTAADKNTLNAVKEAAALSYASETIYNTGTTIDNDTFKGQFEKNAGGTVSNFKFKHNITATLVYKNGQLVYGTDKTDIPASLGSEIADD